MIYPIFKNNRHSDFTDLVRVQESDTTTIEDFLIMLGQNNEWLAPFAKGVSELKVVKETSGAVGAVQNVSSVAAFEPASKEKKQKSPASLLARLYPFMLSAKYSSVTDLCLIGNCTEVELDQLVDQFSSIIEIVWFKS